MLYIMIKKVFIPNKKLRKGWTTGACATAAAKACVLALINGEFSETVSIKLPGGEEPNFKLSSQNLDKNQATAGVIKDAGDDPDVTHGAEIIVTVKVGKTGDGITFKAGEGVGIVTLPGLPLPPGEPAINPAPRKMIKNIIQELVKTRSKFSNLQVIISIPGGDKLAKKTWNPRLGVIGGLSILGTTGIVRPYSCSAWIHSIHRGIDVARATGLTHVAASTGKTSETAVQKLYQLDDTALIDMGDFAGGVLKYLRHYPLNKLTIAGGFGKLTKLAQGHLDLHSKRSELDFNKLAENLSELGATSETQNLVKHATTALTVLDLTVTRKLPLADLIANKARERALATLDGETEVEVCIFDRNGKLVGRAND